MPRRFLLPTLALLGLLGACQRETASPTETPTSAQAQAEAQAQAKDTPAGPGDAAAGDDAQGADTDVAELHPLIERAGGQLRAQDILVSLKPDTLFEPDRADLRVDALAQHLRPLAELANKTKGELQITAHVAATSDPTAALDLSKRRADAVADFLQSQGVAPDRLHTSGMGATDAGSARIEVVLPRPGA